VSTDERRTGTVVWFNNGRGYIHPDGEDITENVYVCWTFIRKVPGKRWRTLYAEQRVSFILAETEKGPQAHDVVVIRPTPEVKTVQPRQKLPQTRKGEG